MADQVTEITRRELLSMMQLTEMQRTFCERYVKHFDAVLAAREAGYTLPKYDNPNGEQRIFIKRAAEQPLKSESVQAYIMLLKQSTAERLKISMDSIIDEYRVMAFARMSDYVRWSDEDMVFIKSSEELTEMQKRGVMEISRTVGRDGTTVKIKLYPKQAALDRLYEILKELDAEEQEREKVGNLHVSAKQIMMIMQDPVKRRAIEHLAEGLFDVRVREAKGNKDKNRERFDKILANIVERFASSSIGGLKEIDYDEGEREVYDVTPGEEGAEEEGNGGSGEADNVGCGEEADGSEREQEPLVAETEGVGTPETEGS